MLQLDHLFVCTASDPPEAATLRKLGFTVEFERAHPGQGTRNLLLLMPRHYLELLFLDDREEAEGNLVRLDRRVDWRESGASPFGIALRGDKSAVVGVPWVHYTLPNFPAGLWIDGRTLDDPRLPLVFVFDRPDLVEGGPATQGYPPRLLTHDCGVTGIRKATVEGPGLGQAPPVPLPDDVVLAEAPQPRLVLALDSPTPVQADVGDLLALR